jgi:hypothetical protein
MAETNYPGIDYSLGQSNYDPETGIHFGVIPVDALTEWVWESFEADYGAPHCPHCGNPARDASEDVGDDALAAAQEDYECDRHSCGDYACDECRRLFDGESAFGDEPIGHDCTDADYNAHIDSDCVDAWILKSPYYTRAQYCSPCAPGAGYLTSPCPDGPKTYCFNHDWFDGGKAPYPVYHVHDDTLVYPVAE